MIAVVLLRDALAVIGAVTVLMVYLSFRAEGRI